MILENINGPKDLKKLNLRELKLLAKDIRDRMISVTSENGGHLGPSLGVVELTIALHYVFNSPDDKFVWDVGHQAYAHKIITGRNEKFESIRKFGGISGFLKRFESEHDVFGAGHASTSISAALGIRVGEHLENLNNKIIAIIGDGSMTGGMAYEALNNFKPNFESCKNMIVILNDNGMSISPNVGGLSTYLSKKLSGTLYKRTLNALKSVLSDSTLKLLKKIKHLIKMAFIPGEFFESLGLRYLGPIDGHDIDALIEVLRNLKIQDSPVLLHIKTQKGKGYCFAESHPETYHGVTKFNSKIGVQTNNKTTEKSFTEIFGDAISEIAENDKKVVAITAAMTCGTGLKKFAKKFPDRFFDVGIAEEHAITFAAGLATSKIKPVVAMYSTFLQRSIDQVLHDVCLQNLPVVFALDRAGLVGKDGPTHHGTFDLTFLRMIPGIIIMAPSNATELRNMLYSALRYEKPVAIRYPKEYTKISNEKFEFIPIGKSRSITQKNVSGSPKILILSTGILAEINQKISDLIFLEGLSVEAIDVRFIKPLPFDILKKIESSDLTFTLEENVLSGGFGSYILEEMSKYNPKVLQRISIFGIDDKFVDQGNRAELLDSIELSEEKILRKIMIKIIKFIKQKNIKLNESKKTPPISKESIIYEKTTH